MGQCLRDTCSERAGVHQAKLVSVSDHVKWSSSRITRVYGLYALIIPPFVVLGTFRSLPVNSKHVSYRFSLGTGMGPLNVGSI